MRRVCASRSARSSLVADQATLAGHQVCGHRQRLGQDREQDEKRRRLEEQGDCRLVQRWSMNRRRNSGEITASPADASSRSASIATGRCWSRR